MIKKVVNNRGGLHNRITRRILLKPFTLAETHQYLQSRNIHFKPYQIVLLYMAMGGIPHYLKEIRSGNWQSLSQTQSYKSWSGHAYENVSLLHIPQIKKALGISGVYSLTSSFYQKGTEAQKRTQIDLLIDRNDHIINVVEVKFYNKPFRLTKAYAEQLQQKLWTFQETTQTRKQLFLTLITTFGLEQNEHSLGLVHQSLQLEDLFEG